MPPGRRFTLKTKLQSDLLELKGERSALVGEELPGFNRTCWN